MSAESLIPTHWSVPSNLRNRLGMKAGRQRAMVHEGHLLLVLHKLPSHDGFDRIGRFFWREPDGTWHAKGSEETGLQPLRRHVLEFEEGVDALEDR